jgi:hypothetical protein
MTKVFGQTDTKIRARDRARRQPVYRYNQRTVPTEAQNKRAANKTITMAESTPYTVVFIGGALSE